MKGVDTIGFAPHFDGTGYPHWKVLMKTYLQAKNLDVWRVTNEDVTNGTKKEKQFDVKIVKKRLQKLPKRENERQQKALRNYAESSIHTMKVHTRSSLPPNYHPSLKISP
jgi:hypothetical protein